MKLHYQRSFLVVFHSFFLVWGSNGLVEPARIGDHQGLLSRHVPMHNNTTSLHGSHVATVKDPIVNAPFHNVTNSTLQGTTSISFADKVLANTLQDLDATAAALSADKNASAEVRGQQRGAEPIYGNDTIQEVCSKAADLVFLLDSSESVKFTNWNLTLKFVKEICDKFALNSTRYAIIRFASDAEVALPLTSFTDPKSRDAAIDDVFYKTGGTRTDIALQKAAEVLQSVEKRKASQVLILVTDGPTNQLEINKNHFVQGKDLVQGPAEILKQGGVALFTIGIEPDSETPDEITTMKEEMEAIASEPTHGHVFIADGYRDLETKVSLISRAACVVNGAWSAWSEFSPCSVTCGFGTKVRMRTCTNPLPANNGAGCTGPRVETQQCEPGLCKLTPIRLDTSADGKLPIEDLTKPPMHQNVLEEGQRDSTSAGCPDGFLPIDISDDQLKASSVYTKDTGNSSLKNMHDVRNSRINYNKNGGAWCAEHQHAVQNDKNQFIEVDFKLKRQVAMVATQGSHSYDNWVKNYSLQYSDDGDTWINYRNGTNLSGNFDRDSITKQILNPEITARYLRICPKEWNADGGKEKHDICLRAGFYSCGKKTFSIRRDILPASTKSRRDLSHLKHRSHRISRFVPSAKRILGRLHKAARHILVRNGSRKISSSKLKQS